MKIDSTVRERYEALRPAIPQWVGDQHWANRLETWDDFVTKGPVIAHLLRKLREDSPGTWEKDIQSIHPELCDLVLEAF